MARYYRKRIYKRKRSKWSIEQRPGFILGSGWSSTQDAYLNRQAFVPIVSSTSQEGVRKVKNITVSLAVGGTNSADTPSYYYALIYLPEGTVYTELSSQGQLYTPSQYVISSGIITPEQGKMRIRTRLARNLNQGDSVYLIIGTNSNSISSASRFNYLVQYAICYN